MTICAVVTLSCSNGQLSAYIQGQDITKSGPDRTLCGQTAQGPLVTSNPRLLLIFNTSKARIAGRGFKARFQFVTGKLCAYMAFALILCSSGRF